jgi:hypothetical protein
MKNIDKAFWIFALVIPILCAGMKSMPAQEKKDHSNPLLVKSEDLKDNDSVTVAGRLRLVGSMPFTRYVITPAGNYDIIIDKTSISKEKLKRFQYKIVKASGTIKLNPVTNADGTLRFYEYILIVNDLSEFVNN